MYRSSLLVPSSSKLYKPCDAAKIFQKQIKSSLTFDCHRHQSLAEARPPPPLLPEGEIHRRSHRRGETRRLPAQPPPPHHSPEERTPRRWSEPSSFADSSQATASPTKHAGTASPRALLAACCCSPDLLWKTKERMPEGVGSPLLPPSPSTAKGGRRRRRERRREGKPSWRKPRGETPPPATAHTPATSVSPENGEGRKKRTSLLLSYLLHCWRVNAAITTSAAATAGEELHHVATPPAPAPGPNRPRIAGMHGVWN